MHQFIKSLTDDHKYVLKSLKIIREKGIHSDEGKKLLFEVKDALLSHIKKEDDELYPVLQEAAKNNTRFASLLKLYAEDMEIVTKAVLNFYKKDDENSSGFNYSIEFGKLFSILKTRIRREEDTLYKEYERVVN